jgi:hypothetical protein
MTGTQQQAPAFPRPTPDPDSAPWWDALREHRLLFQRCRRCGHAQLYFRAVCRECWSRDLETPESSGRGVVYSYSVLYSVGDPVLKEELPYALAIVELDEGARLLTRIVGDPDAVAVGRRVRVVFHDVDEELTLPYFALEEDDA